MHKFAPGIQGTQHEYREFSIIGDEQIAACKSTEKISDSTMLGQFSGASSDLRNAKTPEERQMLVRTMLRTLGFNWLCYCRFTQIGEMVSDALYYGTFSPAGWPKRYFAEKHHEVDPRLCFASRYEWPLIWDLSILANAREHGRDSLRTQRFIEDAERAGIRSGVTFGLVNPRNLDHSVIHFSSATPGKGWIVDSVVGQAYAVGLSLHEFLLHHVATPNLAHDMSGLSEVQRNILNYITNGMSDKEIADQLNMSIHNVDYHLRQLKKRYGAQNRVQLAYITGRFLSN
ncbi:LuxR family transcriptional regulator [Pandoraea sp.]|uniref:helix-turn-helix transcriptional regulator n=1 Tax=Pandoraea sp. TaxID=1883445 RepID=UPI00121928B6|nr:LuxR family transcriptional regulator [Pandoraea sp.]MDE2288750.1 LuxR family transcriptional regulator [Burkholderiales bacterium]MDE2610844.1 LuxR family transcriptional regulator [Burkholderiales bacterium]TAL54277.1 MAG: LuxR family transcriptional regulator [Pandoraea sp.]TAM17173.1 MAG: LuxR family transcriptional regulator [Pandoraea sp.]